MRVAYPNGCMLIMCTQGASFCRLCTNRSGYNLGRHRLEFNNQDSKVVFEELLNGPSPVILFGSGVIHMFIREVSI